MVTFSMMNEMIIIWLKKIHEYVQKQIFITSKFYYLEDSQENLHRE